MKVLRDPLVHFVVAGVVLFSSYAWLNGGRPALDEVEPIRIGTGQVQWLKETYSSQWLRPPDAIELQVLVIDLVNEELLAREAQAMGLGEDDTIIRRRLTQKLKFIGGRHFAAGRPYRRRAVPVFRSEHSAFRGQSSGVDALLRSKQANGRVAARKLPRQDVIVSAYGIGTMAAF